MIFDGEAVSIAQLLSKVVQSLNNDSPLGINVWLMPIPILIMTFLAKLSAKDVETHRLLGSL